MSETKRGEPQIENEFEVESRDKEEIVEELKKERLIVDDGYSYESLEQQEKLPTMFHGTSEYLLDDIKKNGLKSESFNFEKIAEENPRIAGELKRIVEKAQPGNIQKEALDGIIHLTMIFKDAEVHAQKGPERINNLINIQNIGLDKEKNAWSLNDLFPEDTYARRLFLSVLDPKPVIIEISPTIEDLDGTVNEGYANFFTNPEYRKEYLFKIKTAKDNFIKYLNNKENSGLTDEEKFAIWTNLRAFSRIAKTPQEAQSFSIGEIAEIELRSSMYEVLFNKISPEKIINIEKISNK